MALVKSVILKFTPTVFVRISCKNYSSESNIKKSVFISQSKDIYTNLALQEWIYKNFNLAQHHILMLWQNDPCVVIGRDHNPWLEANVEDLSKITQSGVKLARQTTDGHTIYNDSGNLNMTFFTPRDNFYEKYNMEVISRALFRKYLLKTDITENNLWMRGNYKISESTKKLGSTNAFHHCSLMVNINKVDYTYSLMQRESGILQKETKRSVKSKIMNIHDENPEVAVRELLKVIGWEYMRTSALAVKDGGIHLANQQKGFQLINPSESWFPGISKIRHSLTNWQWLYGNTPDFKVARTIRIPDNFSHQLDEAYGFLPIEFSVTGGIIKNITLSVPSNLSNSTFNREMNVLTSTLIGRKFSTNLVSNLEDSIRKLADYKDKKYVSHSLGKVMTCF
ncbi:hypothetical protein WA026_004589 [Henosepilachna vigintioctopunctata]|uniref:BPL/LPL catalytic domain-containing protein n=1 Tax=Henosepilachna vigintioctopunctata TaxID=420089 RepID=A0AAW1VAG7_9CUCU